MSSIIIAATAQAEANKLTIGEEAFYGCSPTYLYLGATVSSIGDEAFGGEWEYLKAVYCMNPTPPTFVGDAHIFNGETYEGTLYVPAGSVDLYATADDWKLFIDYGGQIVGIGDTGAANEITISSAGYATFYIEDAYVMPEGVTGTTVTGVTNTMSGDAEYVLTMPWKYEAGSTVPAKTALVLQGSEGTYEYEITTSEEVAPTDNLLMGSIAETTTTGPNGETTGYVYYELSDGNYGVGFYYGVEGGGAFTSGANKAWLPLSETQVANARFLGFGKGDDTTGISSVESSSEKTVSGIYTIQGVRVSNTNQPGLYIVDGKKVLVK